MSGDYPQNCRHPCVFTDTICCCCGKESKTSELIKHGCNGYCPACYQERIIDHGKKDWVEIRKKKHIALRKEYNQHINR